jgi:ADP-ribosylglycohydrolase
MIGAIAGDMIGRPYEGTSGPGYNFQLFTPDSKFTDDTVLTIACAEALITDLCFADHFRRWATAYPDVNYGAGFLEWLTDDKLQFSYGNGAVMRTTPIGRFKTPLEHKLRLAAHQCRTSHWDKDAIAAAEAVVHCMDLIGKKTAVEIHNDLYIYDLGDLDSYSPYARDTAALAIHIALASTSYEDAIRTAISMGGDTDTVACVTGGIAEVLHGVPDEIVAEARARLPAPMLDIIDRFESYT